MVEEKDWFKVGGEEGALREREDAWLEKTFPGITIPEARRRLDMLKKRGLGGEWLGNEKEEERVKETIKSAGGLF